MLCDIFPLEHYDPYFYCVLLLVENNQRQKGHLINMADQEDLQTPFDHQRAVSLLEEATQFLREYSGGSAVSNQNRSSENSEIQPVGSRWNEPHSSQRLQANHTRLPQTKKKQLQVYLHTRTGKETKITSLAEVWHETVLQMEGYLIIFEVFFHPMVVKRRQLAHQVYNRHPLVNKGNVTHSSLKEKLGLTNFSAWQIKIKW